MMQPRNSLLCRFSAFLVENQWHAVICAVVLALLPYTFWLSSTLIALVTLRKGPRYSSVMLLAVLIASFIYAVYYLPVPLAAVNSLLMLMPCFVLATILRASVNWQWVATIALLMISAIVLWIQLYMPEVILEQYRLLQELIADLQVGIIDVAELNKNSVRNANLLLGVQLAGFVVSAMSSLLLARTMQSNLYNPGGFLQEARHFRANKVALVILSTIFMFCYLGSEMALCLLPSCLLYFFSAGLSLVYYRFSSHKPWLILIVLIGPAIIAPVMVFPVYVVLAALDVLFDFRAYLSRDSGRRLERG